MRSSCITDPSYILYLTNGDSGVSCLKWNICYNKWVLFIGTCGGFLWMLNLCNKRKQQLISIADFYSENSNDLKTASILFIDYVEPFLHCFVRNLGFFTWKCSEGVFFQQQSVTSITPILVSLIPSSHFGFCNASILNEFVAIPDRSTDGDDVVSVYSLLAENVCFTKLCSTPKPLADVKTGMPMRVLAFRRDAVTHYLIGYESGHVILWTVVIMDTEVYSVRMECHHRMFDDSILAMDYNSDVNFGICGTGAGAVELVVWKLFWPGGNELPQFSNIKLVPLQEIGVADVRLRSDGRIFAVACWDGCIRVFARKSLHALAVLAFHAQSSLQCLAFAPCKIDNNWYFASGSKDSRISLWSIYNDS